MPENAPPKPDPTYRTPVGLRPTTAPPAPGSIGSLLVAARTSKGLSREALAEAAGVSYQTIVRVEIRDHLPTVKNLAAIAAVLELDLADLINASQHPAANGGAA